MSENATLEPQKPQIRRKITVSDLEAMAKLVAKRLTEREACSVLGINYHSWQNWECRARNKVIFEEHLSRIKGEAIRACMDTLEEAGNQTNAKTGIREWRAHDRRLDRLAPDRFAMAPSQVNVNLLVSGAPNDLVEAARQAFLRQSTPQPVVSCGDPPKAIELNSTPAVASDSTSGAGH